MVFVGLMATVVLGSLLLYVGRRLGHGLPRPARLSIGLLLLVVMGLQFASFSSIRTARRSLPMEALHWTAYLCFGLLSLIFAGLVLLDLIRLVLWGVDRLRGLGAASAGQRGDPPENPARRGLLSGGVHLALVGLSGVAVAVGYREARRVARVVEVPIPIAGLPAALQGLRIVQISDVHVGPTIRRAYLQGIVDRINELDADIIAITGDLVDGTVEGLAEDIAPLAQLQSRLGAFFCTGNHEYYSGVEPWLEEVARLGVMPLVNGWTVVEKDGASVLVAGVTDYSAARMMASHATNPAAACAGAPRCGARILLAHQPRSAFAAAETEAFDLQLSGHVHGGQYMPWTWLIRAIQPFAVGLHRHKKMWVYTSRGTGYWGPPIRLGSPAEITLLTLVSA